MIPLKDYNPTRRFPVVTVVLIAINAAVFLFVQRPFDRTFNQARFSYEVAAIPCEVVQARPLSQEEVADTFDNRNDSACQHGPAPAGDAVFPHKSVWLAVLYSMFLHGGWLHIGGNMLFLWIFGNNIEDRMGRAWYLAFYLVAGLAAAAAHILVQPDSTVPVVGASGAIAGVMGAYLVLFPNVRIRTLLLFFLVLIRDIPAKWLLGFWFVLQFFTGASAGVAWVAHVGGFAFGAVVALALRRRLLDAGPPAPSPVF